MDFRREASQRGSGADSSTSVGRKATDLWPLVRIITARVFRSSLADGRMMESLMLCDEKPFGAYIGYGIVDELLFGSRTWKSLIVLWIVHGRSWISMTFLLYWQFNGDVYRIYGLFDHPRMGRLASEVCITSVDKYVAFFVIFHIILEFVVDWWGLVVVMLGVEHTSDLTFDGYILPDPLELGYGSIFWTNLMAYQTCTGTVVLALQIGVLLSLRHLFKRQNDRIAELQAEESKGSDALRKATASTEAIASRLQEEAKNHLVLADALMAVNKVFEIHIFIRIVLIIPRLVTSSWRTQEAALDIIDTVSAAHDFYKVAVEVMALIYIPALLHATIRDAETVLWRNEHVWFPYDQKLNELGRTLLARINQQDLGVSLGGYTVITKSLLLTVVSLTVTFLTVFHEIRQTPFADKPIASVKNQTWSQ